MFTIESHCALTVVTELASVHNERGITLTSISQTHNIPLPLLELAASLLLHAGYVRREMGDTQGEWLRLQKNPDDISVYDIVSLCDDAPFTGTFVDSANGELLPKSNLTSIINTERNTLVKYCTNRLKRVSITKLSKDAAAVRFMK